MIHRLDRTVGEEGGVFMAKKRPAVYTIYAYICLYMRIYVYISLYIPMIPARDPQAVFGYLGYLCHLGHLGYFLA